MPNLIPNAKGLPQDWRKVWAVFYELQKIAHRLGEPTHEWKIEYPAGFDKFKDNKWTLHYTVKKRPISIYIGFDSNSAEQLLLKLKYELDQALARRNTALINERMKREDEVDKGDREQPVFVDHIVRMYWHRWEEAIAHIHTQEQMDAYWKTHPKMKAFLNQQAGYLPMSLHRYLSTHPHAKRWPAPPKNEEEYDRRQSMLWRDENCK